MWVYDRIVGSQTRRASNYIKKKGGIAVILAMVGDAGLEPATFCV